MNPIHANQPAPPMPWMRFFRRTLTAQHGREAADDLLRRVQAHYEGLYDQRPVFAHDALRDHVEAYILPGLAFYRTFQAADMTQPDALIETQDVLTALINHMRTRWIKGLTYLPGTYWLFRRLLRRTMRQRFVTPGFAFHWVEDSPRQITFTITRCLYVKTLTAYGAPELTPVYCKLDEVWGTVLAPKVIFERPHMLSHGDNGCEFCYRRGEQGERVAFVDNRWGSM